LSYSTVNTCANDAAFLARLTACIADELAAHSQPAQPTLYLEPFRWFVASASDVEAAYASALAADNPDPGGDESVITDGMILSATQAAWDDVVPAK
jgi:hypothetical protein